MKKIKAYWICILCLTMITTVHAESISEKNEESTEILSDEICIDSEVSEDSESNAVSDSECTEAADMDVTNLSEVIPESSEKDDDNFIDELISDSETIESEDCSNKETDEALKPEENTDEEIEVASKPEEDSGEETEVASEPEEDSDEETDETSELESETEEDTHTEFEAVHEESSSDVKYIIDFTNSPQISVHETINYPKVWNPSSLSYESTTDESCAIKEYHTQCNSPIIGKITNLSDVDVTVFFQFSPSKILYDNGVNFSFKPIHLGNVQSGMNTANIEYAEMPLISETVAHLLYNDITERGNHSFGTLTISVKAN